MRLVTACITRRLRGEISVRLVLAVAQISEDVALSGESSGIIYINICIHIHISIPISISIDLSIYPSSLLTSD